MRWPLYLCCHPEWSEGSAFPSLRTNIGCPILCRAKGGKARTSACVIQNNLPPFRRLLPNQRKYPSSIPAARSAPRQVILPCGNRVIRPKQPNRQLRKLKCPPSLLGGIVVLIALQNLLPAMMQRLADKGRFGRVLIALHKRVNVAPVPRRHLIVQHFPDRTLGILGKNNLQWNEPKHNEQQSRYNLLPLQIYSSHRLSLPHTPR